MSTIFSTWMAPVWLFGVTLSAVWSDRHRAAVAVPLLGTLPGPLAGTLPTAVGSMPGAPMLVRRVLMGAQLLLPLLALVATRGHLAFAALATAGVIAAGMVRGTSRTASIYLGASGLLWGVAGLGVYVSSPAGTLAASLLAIALHCGLFPLHAGVAAMSEHRASRQLQQLAVLPIAAFVHMRFADNSPLAHDLAPALVVIGAASTLLFALVALSARRDMRRLYSASVLMHGGMLFAAVGAAARGHHAAAVLVAVTMVLALTGFSVMVTALESRVGYGDLTEFAGRARAFPRLAAALAFFGGAAVGLPGTAGFVADDLLLHALWEESAWSAATVVVASAVLAVATLATFARVFFGPPQRHLAPDLLPRERRVVVILMLLLLVLGFVPALLASPVNALLR
ncbi:MAG: hypothetical protein IPF98_14120 [Gemmatimonadetes bacterium]|nr:hypothetical protein [Gemmatimonadota bacterium]